MTRFRFTVIGLAVAVVVLFTVAQPAAAQTTFQFRYWSTNDTWYNGTFQPTFASGIYGFTVRRDGLMGGPWGISLSLDRGGITGYPANIGTDAYNQFWNVNVHRNLPLASGMMSVFVGWQRNAVEGPTGGAFPPFFIRQSGVRVGVDGKFAVRGPWFVTGELAYMPTQSATQMSWTTGAGVQQTENASMLNWRGAVGYNFNPMWSAELGYRGMSWNFNPTPMCGGATPCNFNWSGLYVGLNLMTP